MPGCKSLTHEIPAYLSHFQLSIPCSCLGFLQSLKTPHRSCFRFEVHLELPSLLPPQLSSVIISGKLIFLPVQRWAGLEIKSPKSLLTVFFFCHFTFIDNLSRISLGFILSYPGSNCCFVAMLKV